MKETKCQWCGLMHPGACPRVKAIEYHPNGTIKRVEFIDSDKSLFDRVFGQPPYRT